MSATDHFQLAASQGKANAVEVLLKQGADIHAVNNEDRNALYLAAAKNSLETLKVRELYVHTYMYVFAYVCTCTHLVHG